MRPRGVVRGVARRGVGARVVRGCARDDNAVMGRTSPLRHAKTVEKRVKTGGAKTRDAPSPPFGLRHRLGRYSGSSTSGARAAAATTTHRRPCTLIPRCSSSPTHTHA